MNETCTVCTLLIFRLRRRLMFIYVLFCGLLVNFKLEETPVLARLDEADLIEILVDDDLSVYKRVVVDESQTIAYVHRHSVVQTLLHPICAHDRRRASYPVVAGTEPSA